MFQHHNKYTKASFVILCLSSLVGLIFMGMFLPSLTAEQPVLIYILSAVLSLMLLLNTYFAYQIYRRSMPALKLCLWLYGLQILGFETENWALSLNFGMNFSVSWEYETTNITINLLAIIIWFVVFMALRSVNQANKNVNVDSAIKTPLELH